MDQRANKRLFLMKEIEFYVDTSPIKKSSLLRVIHIC